MQPRGCRGTCQHPGMGQSGGLHDWSISVPPAAPLSVPLIHPQRAFLESSGSKVPWINTPPLPWCPLWSQVPPAVPPSVPALPKPFPRGHSQDWLRVTRPGCGALRGTIWVPPLPEQMEILGLRGK